MQKAPSRKSAACSKLTIMPLPQTKKRGSFFQRLGEHLKALACDQRFPGGRADIDAVCKMLCRDNVPVAKTDIAAADFTVRTGSGGGVLQASRPAGRKAPPREKGLHEIVERTDLKALQRVVGRGRGKTRRQSASVLRSSLAASMPLIPCM